MRPLHQIYFRVSGNNPDKPKCGQRYLSLARDLDVMKAELPEEVLIGSGGPTGAVLEKALL